MSLSESIAFKRANYYLIFGIIVVFFEFNDFQIPYTPPSPPLVHTHLSPAQIMWSAKRAHTILSSLLDSDSHLSYTSQLMMMMMKIILNISLW